MEQASALVDGLVGNAAHDTTHNTTQCSGTHVSGAGSGFVACSIARTSCPLFRASLAVDVSRNDTTNTQTVRVTCPTHAKKGSSVWSVPLGTLPSAAGSP